MEELKRSRKYYEVLKVFYAQYIHQIASTIEHIVLTILVKNGFSGQKMNRKAFDKFMMDTYKTSIKSLSSYCKYESFYCVWNFLKHNSIAAYKKVKEICPEILYELDDDEKYINGQYALSYVKIDEEYITNALDSLQIFFYELCQKCFGENIEEASWNYDDYFIREIRSLDDEINNPLGLPYYL